MLEPNELETEYIEDKVQPRAEFINPTADLEDSDDCETFFFDSHVEKYETITTFELGK